MVEIIKDVRELNKNVTLSLNIDNPYLMKEYDTFRKKSIQSITIHLLV